MTSITTASRFKVTLLAVCLLAAPLQAGSGRQGDGDAGAERGWEKAGS